VHSGSSSTNYRVPEIIAHRKVSTDRRGINSDFIVIGNQQSRGLAKRGCEQPRELTRKSTRKSFSFIYFLSDFTVRNQRRCKKKTFLPSPRGFQRFYHHHHLLDYVSSTESFLSRIFLVRKICDFYFNYENYLEKKGGKRTMRRARRRGRRFFSGL
jgi:hypothetical protein